jgi:transcriptional regulator with XRE-family HTH domain
VVTTVYTIDMANIRAVGTYLRTLREAQELSRAEIARALETNEVQVARIEKGEIDTRGSLLLQFLKVVRGDAEQLTSLMTDPLATESTGRTMAEMYLRDWLEVEPNESVLPEPYEVVRSPTYPDNLNFEQLSNIIIDLGTTLQEQRLQNSLSRQSTPLNRKGRRSWQRKKRRPDS